MNIETKFDIGGRVYLALSEGKCVGIDCPICDNKRTVVIRGETFPCPRCAQSQMRKVINVWSVAKPRYVGDITIRKNNAGELVIVYLLFDSPELRGQGNYAVEDFIFKSRGEAEIFCIEQNKVENAK